MSCLKILLVQTGSRHFVPFPKDFVGDVSIPDGCSLSRVNDESSAEALAQAAPDVLMVEHHRDRPLSLQIVRKLRSLRPFAPIVFLAWESSEQLVIDALNAGVSRYLKLPCTEVELHNLLYDFKKASTADSENNQLEGSTCLIGNSASMCELRQYIRQVAPSNSNVLITGETGTGKELVARLIQENSARRDCPFVCLNSAAIPEALVESELFGYEKGAFTGALSSQEGKLSAANRGTVFFDEIGDVSPSVQAKLLRAIESKQLYRLGSNRSRDFDIRILAASNQDLEAAIKQNRFRGDLYYRLNVLRIEVPPLRDRLEDLPVLVDHYVQRFRRAFQKQVLGCSDATMDLLFSYSWPGNVRELKNVLEAAFVTSSGQTDGLLQLPGSFSRSLSVSARLKSSERTMILQALTATNWNRTEAAKRLQWSRMTLYRKMSRYQVSGSVKSRL